MEKMEFNLCLARSSKVQKKSEYKSYYKTLICWNGEKNTLWMIRLCMIIADVSKIIVTVWKNVSIVRGYVFCRQPLHGKYMELRVDGILVQELVNCSYQLQENSLFAHQKKYRLMDMPKQNLLVNISKLDLRNESMEYKHVVMQVLQKLMDEEDTKGLYFWGKPGVGKSYLAAGMCNYYAKKRVWCCLL